MHQNALCLPTRDSFLVNLLGQPRTKSGATELGGSGGAKGSFWKRQEHVHAKQLRIVRLGSKREKSQKPSATIEKAFNAPK